MSIQRFSVPENWVIPLPLILEDLCKRYNIPVGIMCQNDVVSTSLTLIRRQFYIVPAGIIQTRGP